MLRDTKKVKEEESKLRNALEVLKLNSISIPDECAAKLSSYGEQIRKLEERLKQERMLLNYLHMNLIPAMPKRKFAYDYDLLLIAAMTLLIDAAILMSSFDEIATRIIGLPMLLLFPGYGLLAIIFPRIEHLDFIERTAFSLVLSIAVMLLLSFGLDGTSLRAIGLLLAINTIIFMCLGIAMLRRHQKLTYSPFSILKRTKAGESRKEV